MKWLGEVRQYSVHYCTLKAIDRVRTESALRAILNLKQDQILIFDLGTNEEAARQSSTFMGPEISEAESGRCWCEEPPAPVDGGGSMGPRR